MKGAILPLFVALLLCVVSLSASARKPHPQPAGSTVPLYMWSGESYFTSTQGEQHSVESGVVNQAEVSSHLQQAVTQHMQQQSSSPEVLLAFIPTEVSYTSVPRLDSFLSDSEPSSSSLSFPYMQSTASSPAAFVDQVLISALEKSSANKGSLKALNGNDCQALTEHIQESAALLSNGVTDILYFPSLSYSTDSECMNQLTAQVSEMTGGNFIGVASAQQAAAKVQTRFTTQSYAQAQGAASSDSSLLARRGVRTQASAVPDEDPEYTGPQFINSTIMLGLLVVFFMLFILYIGLCCMVSIERPVRFPVKKSQ